ncbi:TPA: YraN family protein [Vibrio parahaemolyticus]|uniref:YraN family protein n=1 Tax=Vibrio parahaemolyticus TaxID=670 RepID=UPI001122089B|nr:YraN family protein [Vibrio parahaemolyticus]EGQ9917194.1 YraN family protein [Vibrio parahaemolyticus]MDF4356239.1 YraN family protein [Vibrio parahaemolyticus]MDF4543884.1 YraN family protein [Vibrio parahaemolyticus]MDG2578741.1 YraN family protein [Vibrio parahaemolyticus]MDG2798009.1 YraN family protein [Vibrio parahaemolyticus]
MGLFSKRQIGNQYETLAKQYLQRQGLRFLDQNYLTKFGEIDLIFQQDETIVFVEVKYRKNDHFGSAAEMVTNAKMRKLIKTAQVWLCQQRTINTIDYRFDVIAIHDSGRDINWIQNAISEG